MIMNSKRTGGDCCSGRWGSGSVTPAEKLLSNKGVSPHRCGVNSRGVGVLAEWRQEVWTLIETLMVRAGVNVADGRSDKAVNKQWVVIVINTQSRIIGAVRGAHSQL